MNAFTYAAYKALLKQTYDSYRCCGFEVLGNEDLDDSFCLLRHDIDMSPASALELAQYEADLGIRATYTVLLNGEFYNPFETQVRSQLLRIAALGHDIGLHFDAAWHQIESKSSLHDAIEWESGILRRLLGKNVPIRVFSFHNPTPFSMSCYDVSYGGLWNAYAGILQSTVSYISDSNGYWRFRSWSELLAERPLRLQVLTHPEWWGADDAHPASRVCSHLERRTRVAWDGYRQMLSAGGRENRSGIPDALLHLPELMESDGGDLLRWWLSGSTQALVELFSRLERQARAHCEIFITAKLGAERHESAELLSDDELRRDPIRALARLAGADVQSVLGCSAQRYEEVKRIRRGLVHGLPQEPQQALDAAFNDLVMMIRALAVWAAPHLLGQA